MKLYHIGSKLCHLAGTFQHHFLGLVGKSVYEMDCDENVGGAPAEPFVALEKFLVGVASVYKAGSIVVNALKSQLHENGDLFRDLCKKGYYLIAKAIGTGGNCNHHGIGECDDLLVYFAKVLNWSIGVCMCLKIRNETAGVPLFSYGFNTAVVLCAKGALANCSRGAA